MNLRTLWGIASIALATSCSSPAVRPGAETGGRPAPQFGSFGFDTAGMDAAVAPGDDFYRFANGTWQRVTEIPADRPAWGASAVLRDLSEERTRTVIEEAAKADHPAGSAPQKVGDYFASFMDEAAIEQKGAAPLQPRLAAIAAIGGRSDLARLLGETNYDDVRSPIRVWIDQDLKANDRYAAYLEQGGLGLPDRDYYLDGKNEKFAEARGKYQAHIASMLRLAGIPDAPGKAARVYALERKIAEAHWSRAESRQVDKLYNPIARADLAAKLPGLDWTAFLRGAGLDAQSTLVATQLSAIGGMSRLVGTEPLEDWRAYLAFHTISRAARVLPKAFVDEDFAFTGVVLSGAPQIRERWKRGVEGVNTALGEAVGQLYVARYFPPDAKAKADDLIRNLVAAMDARLQNLAWMAPETRAKARQKLAAFTPKIGYPDTWRDYSSLEVVRGDAFGNDLRGARFEYQRNLNKLGRPIDRGEWGMTPQTVNAYANPLLNEIVFPAAILQPPFFDPDADPAVNYGGIGAVIGHEITHHFDDQGRKFDARGELADWWTAADVERFKVHTDRIVAQYAAYEPLPGVHVNGELTLGENIADLAGLAVAYDAYRLSLRGRQAPVIDGFSGDQRFFLGYAQIWRNKQRDENLLRLLTTDTHTPGLFRPYVVRNLDAWYAAFGVQPGQRLYLDPDERVRVW